MEDNEGKDIWEFLQGVWHTMRETIKRGIENEGVLPGPIKPCQEGFIAVFESTYQSWNFKKPLAYCFLFTLAAEEKRCRWKNCNCANLWLVGSFTSHTVLPELKSTTEVKIHRALATAGLIGNLVKHNASISGAEVGCQGEIQLLALRCRRNGICSRRISKPD